MSATQWTDQTAEWARQRVLQHLDHLPAHMHQGVMAYLERGQNVGGFLTSLFEGDKEGAVKRADPMNRAAWPHWVSLVDVLMPHASVGSREKAKAWRAQGGLSAYVRKEPERKPSDNCCLNFGCENPDVCDEIGRSCGDPKDPTP